MTRLPIMAVAAFTLGLGAAQAEPLRLGPAQMDGVTAGVVDVAVRLSFTAPDNLAVAGAIAAGTNPRARAAASTTSSSSWSRSVSQASS